MAISDSISDKKVVTITYDLSVTDENQEKVLVESAEADAPMVFLFGQSGLPDEFESQLSGKNPGEDDVKYGRWFQLHFPCILWVSVWLCFARAAISRGSEGGEAHQSRNLKFMKVNSTCHVDTNGSE